MLAAVTFDFDPTISPFGLDVRLETLALAALIFVTLVAADLAAGRSNAAVEADSAGSEGDEAARSLRRDDVLLIAIGAVPGAVVGARIDYGLVHYDYFSHDFGRLLDPAQGGLGLTLGVVLGVVTALVVILLVSASISRWLHLAAVPLLATLGLGKLVMLLGGEGQGRFSDGSWAVSFKGDGPWWSPSPDVPALPSQAFEGALILVAAVAIVVLPILLRLRLRRWRSFVRPTLAPPLDIGFLTGYRRFLTAICLWAAIRFAVAFTWRDAQILGPLNAEQVILAVVLAGFVGLSLLAWWLDWRRGRRQARLRKAPSGPELSEPKGEPEPAGLPEPKSLERANELPEPRSRAKAPLEDDHSLAAHHRRL